MAAQRIYQGVICLFATLTATGCVGITRAPDIRSSKPDEIVTFDYGWDEAALCSLRKLDDVSSSNNLRQYPAEQYAEIFVNATSDEQTLIIDFRDVSPGKAVASIRSNPGLVFKGAFAHIAGDAIKKCQHTG